MYTELFCRNAVEHLIYFPGTHRGMCAQRWQYIRQLLPVVFIGQLDERTGK